MFTTETETDFRKKNYYKPKVFMETSFPNSLLCPFEFFCDKIEPRKYEKCSLVEGSEVNKSGVFIANFEQILLIFLVFQLLTLNE